MCENDRNNSTQEIEDVDIDTLTDINELRIDSSMPIKRRIESLYAQTNNPQLFKSGNHIVKISFLDTNRTLDELLLENAKRK